MITLPVSDVERALQFYVDRVGFALDVDYSPNDAFRVVQLTPPGSSCTIQIGSGFTDHRITSQSPSRPSAVGPRITSESLLGCAHGGLFWAQSRPPDRDRLKCDPDL